MTGRIRHDPKLYHGAQREHEQNQYFKNTVVIQHTWVRSTQLSSSDGRPSSQPRDQQMYTLPDRTFRDAQGTHAPGWVRLKT